MCIGLPMCVLAVEPGHALCEGRGETRRVRTTLLGEVMLGEHLLIFLDSARERLDPARAAEIDATLDLLQAVMALPAEHELAPADPGFVLPSSWTAAQLRVLSGAAAAPLSPRSESLP